MMQQLLDAMRQHTAVMQTHSKRIAAILELVSNFPDGSPTQQAARRAQIYTIAQQARQEIEEEPVDRTIPFRRT